MQHDLEGNIQLVVFHALFLPLFLVEIMGLGGTVRIV